MSRLFTTFVLRGLKIIIYISMGTCYLRACFNVSVESYIIMSVCFSLTSVRIETFSANNVEIKMADYLCAWYWKPEINSSQSAGNHSSLKTRTVKARYCIYNSFCHIRILSWNPLNVANHDGWITGHKKEHCLMATLCSMLLQSLVSVPR